MSLITEKITCDGYWFFKQICFKCLMLDYLFELN